MINIRYHIVSITAVFLALGIGTALGSTFLDRYTVNLLDRNISSAEGRIRAAKADNTRLSHELADARARDASLIENATPGLANNRLATVPVLVVAAAGVDEQVVDGVRSVLAHSGADLRGTLQLRPGMRFDGNIDKSVADIVGTDFTNRKATQAAVDAALDQALMSAGRPKAPAAKGTTTTTTTSVPVDGTTSSTSSPPTSTSPGSTPSTTSTGSGPPSTGPDGTEPAVVAALLNAGYLRLTPGPGHTVDEPILETRGYRYVFLSGPALEPADDAALLALLPAQASGAPLPAVVVSRSVPPSTRANPVTPGAVAAVRGSALLATLYNTVDDVETFSGLVAMVDTLEGVGTLAPGHYGQGEGATSILPPAS